MKDKFMRISIRQDGYGMFSNGGWASYNRTGKSQVAAAMLVHFRQS